MLKRKKNTIILILIVLSIIIFFFLNIFFGPVSISAQEVIDVIIGNDKDSTSSFIIMQSRLPMACTALLAGASLSAAGLIMQSAFRNPLAGPSILGISSGASLGVAFVVLASGLIGISSINPESPIIILIGASLGAGIIILALTFLSIILNNSAVLLIAGVMINYLCSSLISLLNYFAPSDDVKMFVVWGLGSFGSVSLSRLPVMAALLFILIIWALFLNKPLDALLLGERYAANLGYNMKKIRTSMLIVSGGLTAVTTAYCGPIGFIGLIIPHICRGIFNSSSHQIIMPASILLGSALTLACNLCCVLPDSFGVIPINSITPIIGVPIIIYLLINRKSLKWMN